jgi:hypothetical protein
LRISIMGKLRHRAALAQAQLLQSLCHYSTAKRLLKHKKSARQISRRLKNLQPSAHLQQAQINFLKLLCGNLTWSTCHWVRCT